MPDQFPPPSHKAFEELADNDPDALARWILSGELQPADLSFAVEILGHFGGPEFNEILLGFLAHPSPLVREGVAYGFRMHPFTEAVTRALKARLEFETSPGVREAIEDVLVEEAEVAVLREINDRGEALKDELLAAKAAGDLVRVEALEEELKILTAEGNSVVYPERTPEA